MKKIVFSVFVILMLTLTACGSASNGTQQAASTQQDGSLPIQEQVLIGTFKLEGTPQAVTAQQAAQLLPLWQVYKDLSGSDTAAQEEIDGLIQQIQDTMTPEQMQAIAAMNITRQDMFTVMQDRGIAQAGGQRQGNGSGSNGQNGNGGGFVPPEGGPPGGFAGGFGGGGGGGGGFNGGGGQGGRSFTPEQIATAQAARGGGGGSFGFNRIPSGLIDALIQLLQTKAGS
jgi:hypothetical protein